MTTRRGMTRWRRWVLVGVGGGGRSVLSRSGGSGGLRMNCAQPIPLWRWKVRVWVWLPVVGSSCTYAPSDDQRVVMVVFDGAAWVFAVVGWVLIGAA
ncbi:hypothetical protein ACFVX3_19985 [Rhodococcus erythropolis]